MNNFLKLSREDVIKAWVRSGIKDFRIADDMSDKWPFYVAFFYHQGLEKLCKAYLLGTMASEYESLSRQEAKKRIDEIARDKKKMGHNLSKMIERLIEANVLDKSILTKKYKVMPVLEITGEKFIEILEKAYTECRYPVPDPVHKKYSLNNKGKVHWVPRASSDLEEFAYQVRLIIIEKLEKDFNMTIPRDELSRDRR